MTTSYESIHRVRNLLVPVDEIARLDVCDDKTIAFSIRQLTNAIRGLPVRTSGDERTDSLVETFLNVIDSGAKRFRDKTERQ